MGQQQIKVNEMVGSYPVCASCGETSVVRDAWANWSRLACEWVLKSVFDEFACNKCGETGDPIWKVDQEFRTKRICRLNDEMRIGNVKNGTIVMTSGVQALSDEGRAALVVKRGAILGHRSDHIM